MQSRDVTFWKEVIDDEIGSIMENNTWVLSDLPPGCKPLGCKWIFKRNMKVDGIINKFKARLINLGFRKKEGIDYFDTYALVARIITIRLLLALAAIHNLVIHQMDVKTAFLNGDLEEVYIKQLEGFVVPGASWDNSCWKIPSSTLDGCFLCLPLSETLRILAHCYSRPTSGHYNASVTAKKVYESGFYWPSVFNDANEYIIRCDACQYQGTYLQGMKCLKLTFKYAKSLMFED
ncbi:zinc finger, CCHC-type containing protein [Tanacetum coccineum]